MGPGIARFNGIIPSAGVAQPTVETMGVGAQAQLLDKVKTLVTKQPSNEGLGNDNFFKRTPVSTDASDDNEKFSPFNFETMMRQISDK